MSHYFLRITDGWAQFTNVAKISYLIGVGFAKGRVYAKTRGDEEAQLVGYSTLKLASAGGGMGATLTSEIIFFQNEAAFTKFSNGDFQFETGAKVTVATMSADYTIGTTGIPLVDRFVGASIVKADDELKYHDGMATFVLAPKVGMMVDLSVVGQKFTFDSVSGASTESHDKGWSVVPTK